MRKAISLYVISFFIQFSVIAQNVGIGTTNPLARLHVVDSSVLFSAPGDIPATPHNTPISLGGRRLMWYADKAAFRVGYAVYNEWDSVNIGKYSVGMGYGNMATGLYSASIGHGSGASGISSFATGDYTNAVGDYTFTSGQYSYAKKAYSFASGYYSLANGYSSIAIGYKAVADGDYGVALGDGSFANGAYSYSMGYNAGAYGSYSFAAGNFTEANGNSAAAFGTTTTAGGNYSFAAGYNCQANGIGSISMGSGNTASGTYSFAAGSSSHANGYTSVALGDNTTAGGFASFSMGDFTNAGGDYSFAMGISATASGSLSVAMGNNIVASGNNSKILGSNLFDAGHKGNVMLGDTDPWNAGSVGSGTDDQMICRFNNGYYFITGGNTNRTGILANHGDNSWSAISDSTKKEKVLPVNGEAFLHKISQFKLGTWNYKGQDSKTFRHYGPMAQDFHNAFGHDAIGNIGCDTLINQQDFLGVSFIAIQALEKRTEKIEEQQKQLTDLQNQNKILLANNEKLQQQLQLLLSTVSTLDKKVQQIAAINNKSNPVAKK